MRRITKTAWAAMALLLSNACGKDDAGTTPTLDVGFVDAVTPPVGGGGGGGEGLVATQMEMCLEAIPR